MADDDPFKKKKKPGGNNSGGGGGDALDKEERRELREMLDALSLSGGYDALINKAIIYDWSPQEFVTNLVASEPFQRRFPGIVGANGVINDFLLGQEGTSLSPTTLGRAISNYRSLWQSYEEVGKRFGYGNLNRNQIAMLIRNEMSPDEFGAKANAVTIVTKNKAAFDAFNQQRRALGLEPLNKSDLFRAVATEDQKFYDAYEATRLRMMDLGLGVKGAKQVANALGNVDDAGRFTGATSARTMAQIVAEFKANQADIGPELAAAGISRVKLAKFLANPTTDPDLARQLDQLMATRRGQGAYVAGSRPRAGATGPATATDAPIASYG